MILTAGSFGPAIRYEATSRPPFGLAVAAEVRAGAEVSVTVVAAGQPGDTQPGLDGEQQ